MKELHKKGGESHAARRRDHATAGAKKKGGTYAARRRGRRRKGRTGGIVLVMCVLLAVVVVADYLANEGEILQAVGFGGPAASEEQQSAAPAQEEVAEDQGAEDPTAPTVLLGEFFTDYAWDPDPGRRANLRMSAEAIDNTRLAPGEEFSAIEVLSPLDYEPAKVFANGGVDYVDGGGLCQISSTLYMAANYAGLEITERNQHYAEVPYIKPGLDATVWFGDENGWGALDMKFKNNTDGDVLIREFVNEDGFLVAQIWGEKPTGKVVSMSSEKVEEGLDKGIEWATYKKVTDKNGKVLEDGLLYESVYSYNPPVPPEMKHETDAPRGAGWVDSSNTTNWNDKD